MDWIDSHLHSSGPYGPHTPISVYLRVIFFGIPYTWCVMYGIRQCNRIFSCGENSAFIAKNSIKKKNLQLRYWIKVYTTKYLNLISISDLPSLTHQAWQSRIRGLSHAHTPDKLFLTPQGEGGETKITFSTGRCRLDDRGRVRKHTNGGAPA